jgi:hypothetical protein
VSQGSSYESRYTEWADRIGAPANAKDGAFDQIIAKWKDGGPRLTCLEMDDLATLLVGWIADGDYEVAQNTFVELERVLAENVGDESNVISAFVGPCLLESLWGAIRDVHESGSGTFTGLNTTVTDLMGPNLRALWITQLPQEPGSGADS